MIGTLSGFAPEIPTGPLFGAGAHLTAIFVGARADFEAMNAFITEHEIHPVIDRVFEFAQAPAGVRPHGRRRLPGEDRGSRALARGVAGCASRCNEITASGI